MSTGMDSEALKRLLLELLRSDPVFRRAAAAELGLLELLERMGRLEERMGEHTAAIRALQEQAVKLWEAVKTLQERVVGLEERMVKLEERVAKLEEQMVKLWEAVKALEERIAKLEEHMVKLQEQVVKLWEKVEEHSRVIRRFEERFSELQRLTYAVAHRFGVISEAAFREALKDVIEEIFGVGSVSKLTLRDEEGIVYGYPSEVDIDVVVRDKQHVIIEVKSRVDPGDVRIAALKARLYEKVYGVKPRVLIVAGLVHPKAYEAAARLGVEIKPAVKVEGFNV